MCDSTLDFYVWAMENYHTLSPHVTLCHNMAENIDKCNAMNTVGQCTIGDDPQCNAEMQNASAQCEQGGGVVNGKCAELTMANLGSSAARRAINGSCIFTGPC